MTSDEYMWGKGPGPVAIPLESQVVKDFMMARGVAIAVYADVEQSLVELYAVLMRVSPDYAGVSFFRINNSRARNAILERLLKKRHGAKYNLFWNSLVKPSAPAVGLRSLDETRNQIVHWGLLPIINPLKQIVGMKLTPPNYWDRTQNTPKMDVPAIGEFVYNCKFMIRALRMLRHVSTGKKPKRRAWRDICQQPIAYPLPDNHLLSPKSPELQIPHVPLWK